MTLSQNVQWKIGSTGERYPVLVVTASGVHDSGRLVAVLSHGHCEHISLARDVTRELNRTAVGRATLRYLVSHGGPELGPSCCEECERGNHIGCRQVHADPADDVVCSCFESGVSGVIHEG